MDDPRAIESTILSLSEKDAPPATENLEPNLAEDLTEIDEPILR